MIKEKLKGKFWDTLHFLCYDPKRLVRVIVLSICSVVVIFQLTECFHKLIHPPISTHSRFELNDSMQYPAITFCRNPPYKFDVMQRYNLTQDQVACGYGDHTYIHTYMQRYNLTQHPKYASAFNKFDFNESTLEELFHEATYSKSDFFIQYGLNGLAENIEITSGMHLDMGQCFTMNPLVTTEHSWKAAGYSILLMHDTRNDEYFLGDDVPGWHVFIHDQSEGFAENRMQSSGRIEYLFVEVDEEVEVKLSTQHFYMLPSADNLCTTETDMSSTRCSELCHWHRVVDIVGCTGPWMPDIDVDQCDTANETQQLIKHYKLQADQDSVICGCFQPCSTTIYTAFVMNRKKFNITIPAGQIWLYYTSKMVTIVEEFHGYDLTQFVADLGGSLGFLLGLSVLGLIGLLEKIVELLFIRRLIAEKVSKRKQDKEQQKVNDQKGDEISQNFSNECSDTTLAVAAVKN